MTLSRRHLLISAAATAAVAALPAAAIVAMEQAPVVASARVVPCDRTPSP
ncbi:MAG: hypothetical protein JWQ83_1145 [Lacunisphaera sp.]|nr:hypothetical protein [Lacunisphaera sp.]